MRRTSIFSFLKQSEDFPLCVILFMMIKCALGLAGLRHGVPGDALPVCIANHMLGLMLETDLCSLGLREC